MTDFTKHEPSPQGWEIKHAGHHWLEHIDSDGHTFGLVVLQWNPGAKRWSHSGYVGACLYVPTFGWRYVAPCPMPPVGVAYGLPGDDAKIERVE